MKRPCGVIAEEASLDELLEKTGKLEHELRRQLDLKKQKMLDNGRIKTFLPKCIYFDSLRNNKQTLFI